MPSRLSRSSAALRFFALAAIVTLLGAPLACSPADDDNAADEARAADLAAIEQQRDELETSRAELADLEGQLASGEADDVAALQAEIAQKDGEVTSRTEELNQALAEFINSDAPVAGEPLTDVQQRALRLKASEDAVVAQEYITEGGDYARAVGIYGDILAFDPDNAEVKAAMEEAERMRYMTEERFAAIKKGMSDAEVRAALGTVNPRNRRMYDDSNTMSWFYPKSADRDAAAVHFRKKGSGWEVYQVDFDAVKKQADGEEESA